MIRKAHATTNMISRELKARKIEALLNLDSSSGPLRILEIGTGSGGIAHYFATHSSLECVVTAVDIEDNRQVHDGYEYALVQGVKLPFGDAQFDVVISNHVIEHVGGYRSQLKHLKEIARVLSARGSGYLAVPNRWMLIEPHYALPFLSWLPKRAANRYLALSGRGDEYDCTPLQNHELHALLGRAGLHFQHREFEALQAISAIEPTNKMARLASKLPQRLLRVFTPFLPTLICTLNHRSSNHAGH
ncbi:MAG: methyltransferase type 11 [Stenotrophomonas sp.]|nr:MAG: methyltransferase type 11 [Stenotrophomonas sp.]